MKLEKPSSIDRQLWLRALGVEGKPDERLRQDLDMAEKVLLQEAEPKGIYSIEEIGALPLTGTAIKKHLDGCCQMVVMGATAGIGTDKLIRTAQIRDMAQAVIFDCGASVLIEQICDLFQEKIEKEISGFLTGRYSPGYGDWPIEIQQPLLKIIDGSRKIGLTATQNSLLIPRKSITAVLGISREPGKGYQAVCEECILKGKCKLREKGKNCAHEIGLEK